MQSDPYDPSLSSDQRKPFWCPAVIHTPRRRTRIHLVSELMQWSSCIRGSMYTSDVYKSTSKKLLKLSWRNSKLLLIPTWVPVFFDCHNSSNLKVGWQIRPESVDFSTWRVMSAVNSRLLVQGIPRHASEVIIHDFTPLAYHSKWCMMCRVFLEIVNHSRRR